VSSGYRIQIPPTTELHRKEIELRITQLREVFGRYEVWFHSPDEVLTYLHEIGVRQQRDRVITKHILYRWRRKMNFPWGAFNHQKLAKINVSNLMIMAWLWSMRVYKATKNYNPSLGDLADATAHLL
jgi:hypothetical protein